MTHTRAERKHHRLEMAGEPPPLNIRVVRVGLLRHRITVPGPEHWEERYYVRWGRDRALRFANRHGKAVLS